MTRVPLPLHPPRLADRGAELAGSQLPRPSALHSRPVHALPSSSSRRATPLPLLFGNVVALAVGKSVDVLVAPLVSAAHPSLPAAYSSNALGDSRQPQPMQTTRRIRRLQRRRPRNREERGSERLRGTILQECCGHCSRGSATFSLCLPLHVATALLRLVRHCPTLFLPLALSPGSLARFTQPLLPRRRSFVGIQVECALQSAPFRPDAPPPPTRTSLSGCAWPLSNQHTRFSLLQLDRIRSPHRYSTRKLELHFSKRVSDHRPSSTRPAREPTTARGQASAASVSDRERSNSRRRSRSPFHVEH